MLEPPGTSDRSPASRRSRAHATFTGNRALQIEEPLIFEIGRAEIDRRRPRRAGRLQAAASAGCERKERDRPAGPHRARDDAPLCAPQSQKNYGIDTGLFPLGSCTMKHNARLNEKMARLPGFGDIHPLQPVSTVQGALDLMQRARRAS